MSLSDFDPTNIESSSEEVLPKKREKSEADPMPSSLPDPLELIKSFKAIEKPKVKKKAKKISFENSVISKPPVMNKSELDEIEQYDYFANQSTAILDNWKSPQDLPDLKLDRKKLIKKVDMRRNTPQNVAASLERELARREKAKTGLKRWKTDEEVKMKQQYDS